MKQDQEFFESCPEDWRDGYLINVRNRLSNMLEKEYLPKEMKEEYIKKFGEIIIPQDEFIEWYCSIRKG